MNSSSTTEPHIEHMQSMQLVGLSLELSPHAMQEIPELWEKFLTLIDDIPDRKGKSAYGVCIASSAMDNAFSYLAGVSVSTESTCELPMQKFIVPAETYAVFTHYGHIRDIKNTIHFAFDQWLPDSGYMTSENPVHFFEKYGPQFNSQMGINDIEIWLPIVKP